MYLIGLKENSNNLNMNLISKFNRWKKIELIIKCIESIDESTIKGCIRQTLPYLMKSLKGDDL